jgi:hypothetical protein
MVEVARSQPSLTLDQETMLFMMRLADDTEEAPWMTMGDLQFWSASGLAYSLRQYARGHGRNWYVASMLPIDFQYRHLPGRHRLSPDLFVAFVPDRPRLSFSVAEEGVFPPFIVEVVSPSSVARDEEEKLIAYRAMDVQEYLLFNPYVVAGPTLHGFHRDPDGRFVAWQAEDLGGFWSSQLELAFSVHDGQLQARTAAGDWLLVPDQAERELRAAQAARQRAEAEAEQLRQELRALRERDDRPGTA